MPLVEKVAVLAFAKGLSKKTAPGPPVLLQRRRRGPGWASSETLAARATSAPRTMLVDVQAGVTDGAALPTGGVARRVTVRSSETGPSSVTAVSRKV